MNACESTKNVCVGGRDLATLRHQGNINEDVSMKNKYTFPNLSTSKINRLVQFVDK